MTTSIQPTAWQPPVEGATNAWRDWLDGLSTGACDQETFLHAVNELVRKNPDSAWDLLSLLDQYYRRGKFKLSVFQSIKSRLEGLVLGRWHDPEKSVPLPQMMGPGTADQDNPAPPSAPDAARIRAPTAAQVSSTSNKAYAGPLIAETWVSTPITPRISEPPDAAWVSIPIVPRISEPPDAAWVSTPIVPRISEPPDAARVSIPIVPRISEPPDAAWVSAPIVPRISEPPDAAWVSAPSAPVDAPLEAALPAPPLADAPAHANQRVRAPAEGDVLRGRYRLLRMLGRGGTGTVFEAIDQYRLDIPGVGQRLAIKVLNSLDGERPQNLTDLRREFQHLQSLSHPNIVRVHEYDLDDDTPFFTMEYLEGALLSRVLTLNSDLVLDSGCALAIIRDIGSALAHAHDHGVVHGDLNPGNIYITDDGEVRILDFGASRKLHHGPWISDDESADQVTTAAPSYASCELLEGHQPDTRDDLYSFACVVYLLLTGRHPFQNHTALQARSQRLKPARPAGLSRREWEALRTGLTLDRERRPDDVRQWLEQFDLRRAARRLPALTALTTSSRHRDWNPMMIAAGAAVAALLAMGWWAATHRDSMARRVSGSEADSALLVRSTEGPADQTRTAARSAGTHDPDAAPNPRRSVTADDVHERAIASQTPPADQSTPTAETRTSTSPADAQVRAPGVQVPATVPPSGNPASQADQSPPQVQAPAAIPSPEDQTRAAPSPPVDQRTAPAVAATHALTNTQPANPTAAARSVPAPLSPPPPVVAATAGAAARLESGGAPRTHIELAADAIDVSPLDASARVMVRRRGSLRGDVTFTWWTESGTAKPGRDFATVAPHVEHMASGQNSIALLIPLVAEKAQRQPKSFYVVIDEPGPGAALGSKTLTMITISPP